MGYLGLFFVLGACLFLRQRAGCRRRKRAGKRNPGFYPTWTAAGSAFQLLQAQFLEPQTKYVVAEKLDESEDEDEESGPKDPTAHLLRQARRIRSGKPVDRLTTLLPP
jgi:hypothetical protein